MWTKQSVSFITTMIPTIIATTTAVVAAASPSSSLLNDSMNDNNNNNVAYTMMITTGCITIVLASALAYTILGSSMKTNTNKSMYNSDSNATTDKQLRDSNGDTNKIDPSNGHSNSATTPFDYEQYPGGAFSVYYGTQTGTAESFARVLEREGKQKGFLVHVVDLDDIQNVTTDFTSVERCVFLVATYGEGEPPDNAVTFVHSLQATSGLEILFEKAGNTCDDNKENNDGLLKKMDYAVFGLGNKQYDNYNAMGKYLDKVFEMFGGTRVVPLGLGDDDDDLENDFDTWKDTTFWPHFEKLYLPQEEQQRQQANKSSQPMNELPDCRYEIEYYTDAPSSYIHSTSTATDVYNSISSLDQVHSSSKHHFTSFDCAVRVVRELRNVNGPKEEDVGSTIHMEIDISTPIGRYNDGILEYTTADNLGILPMNETSVVDTVASLLQLPNIDTTIFSLKASPKHEWHGVPFPMPITIRECLTRYCDLTGPLRRSDLKLLASYASDPIDRKVLLRMSSKEGKNEYREKIVDSYVGMVDLLKLCPSVSMPWEHFLNICSPMQSRFYTISSSSSVYPKSIHITVAVSQNIRQQDQTIFKGLCSNYLANCRPDRDTVRIFVRPSSFRLPPDLTTPILMIGPGTGIAPMRALIQERAYQYKLQQQQQGKNILYFGCKKSTQDYIYEDELQSYVHDGTLDTLLVAFSREHNQKVYVQNLLSENSHETFELIHNDKCYIYVCGGVKMGQDVHETLQKILHQSLSTATDNGGTADLHAKEYLSRLTREHRYIQELWA